MPSSQVYPQLKPAAGLIAAPNKTDSPLPYED
jgi:hypothetical protein